MEVFRLLEIRNWRLEIKRLPLLIVMLVLLVGCGGTVAAVEGVVVESTAVLDNTAVPYPTNTLPPPQLLPSSTPQRDMPSFAPADPTQVSEISAENTRTADATATALARPTGTPEVEPTATITPTPQPTFTPPALPFTSNEEHFWLRRPIPEGGVVWTDKVYPYGSTRSGSLQPHHGVEFYVPSGTEILAAASGTAVVAGNDLDTPYGPQTNFYGNLVVIELDSTYNGQPIYNLYGHLSEVLVTVGQHVDSQELIGLSGATGVAVGPHLHFEVREGSNDYASTRNPLLWLYPFPDNGAIAGRVTWPDGTLAQEVPITLRRVDAPSKYHATTSYSSNTVNGDDQWHENFAFDDVEAGYYEVEIQIEDKKYKQELWVFPYRTSFVEITLGGS